MAVHYPCLDLIRVCACYLVIVLHVAAMQFERFFPAWPVALVFDSLARMSVPLFFMLSGFLLLDARIDRLSRFYYRRYLRILLPFAFVCLLYYFTPAYADFTPGAYLRHLAVHYVDYHLWYVYALIGIYLALPFFIRIAAGPDGPKLCLLYLAIWAAAFIITPALWEGNPFAPEVAAFQEAHQDLASAYVISDLFSSFFMNWNLLFFYGFMGYLLIAGLLRRVFSRIGPGLGLCGLCVWLLATLAIIFLTWQASLATGAPTQRWFHNLSPFVALQAIAFFIFCCRFRRPSPLLRNLASKCYWIYLLHLLLLRLFNGLCPLPDDFRNLIAIPGYALAIFLTAWCAAIPLAAIERRLLKILGVG